MLKLRGAFSPNARLAPLLDGTVKVKDVEIDWEMGSPGPMFHRHLKDNAFDVFEFSISDYMITQDRPRPNDWEWTALPIFLSRAFLALNTRVHVNSGITSFRDLKGKSYGMPDFIMTAALWLRAMIKELYGIHPQDVAWYNGRPRGMSHGVQLGLDHDPPPSIKITWLQDRTELGRMLNAGEIAAGYGDSTGGDGVPVPDSPNLKRLFEHDGGRAFIEEFYRKTGFTPVNHTVVVQRRLVEQNPWLPEALYDALERSKQEAYRRDRDRAYLLFLNTNAGRQAEIFGADPYPSGVATNRRMLTMAAQQSFEEGLIGRVPNVEELFAESLRST
jgi:4,5-dihydroxyphthalate decarboxylase